MWYVENIRTIVTHLHTMHMKTSECNKWYQGEDIGEESLKEEEAVLDHPQYFIHCMLQRPKIRSFVRIWILCH